MVPPQLEDETVEENTVLGPLLKVLYPLQGSSHGTPRCLQGHFDVDIMPVIHPPKATFPYTIYVHHAYIIHIKVEIGKSKDIFENFSHPKISLHTGDIFGPECFCKVIKIYCG